MCFSEHMCCYFSQLESSIFLSMSTRPGAHTQLAEDSLMRGRRSTTALSASCRKGPPFRPQSHSASRVPVVHLGTPLSCSTTGYHNLGMDLTRRSNWLPAHEEDSTMGSDFKRLRGDSRAIFGMRHKEFEDGLRPRQ
jgi:hypothetical protein